MSNRWKVVRWERPFPTPHHRWEVIEDLGTAEEFHGPFTTHAEAMFFADRMARIEPEPTPLSLILKIPTKRPDKRGPLHGHPDPNREGYNLSREVKKKTQMIYLENSDLIPVALTLLATARKERTA